MYIKKKINSFKEKKTKKIIYINWRFITLCSLVFLFLVILTLRIIFLQIIDSKKLAHEGDRRTLRIQSVISARGIINDRSGYPLAVAVPVNAVFIDPTIVINTKDIKNNIRWKALSEILSIPLSKILFRINSDKNIKFIYLARQINAEIGDYIKALKLPGVFLIEESKRYYPSGDIAAQLIGINNIDGEGIEGIEKSFNTYLTGKPGKRKIRKDNQGHIIENESLINKSNPNNLVLSIDKKLQKIVYKTLNQEVNENKADFGIAILINIKTGEILAMANSPSYNPNDTQYMIRKNLRNRAIADVFEPGSTVKPIVIMEALRNGKIKKNSIINTKPYFIKKHKIKDVSYHDQLNITGILKKSSNVGVSKIALSMSTSELINSYITFGLGQPTNLGLIGEQKGFLPKKKNLSALEKATFSFGYGFMITPLQLARLYTIIGSYGIYRPLSIIKIDHPLYEKRIFPEKYVKNVINMLETVTEPGEGGSQAAIKGYRVAIKTGTVKKVGNKGYYIKKYIAYTAGIAPVSDPQFSLTIVIDNPKGGKYYGGAVSAPIFGKIMKLVLEEMKVKPDKLKNKS